MGLSMWCARKMHSAQWTLRCKVDYLIHDLFELNMLHYGKSCVIHQWKKFPSLSKYKLVPTFSRNQNQICVLDPLEQRNIFIRKGNLVSNALFRFDLLRICCPYLLVCECIQFFLIQNVTSFVIQKLAWLLTMSLCLHQRSALDLQKLKKLKYRQLRYVCNISISS